MIYEFREIKFFFLCVYVQGDELESQAQAPAIHKVYLNYKISNTE